MANEYNFQVITSDDEQYEGKAKIALLGLSNGGKTFSALRLAGGLGKKIVVIDTENKTSLKYRQHFKKSGVLYDVIPLGAKHPKTGKRDYSPKAYINAVNYAEEQGYEVCIIDSLSHAWSGEGGELDMVNEKTISSKSGNSYIAWKDVTPWHNKLIDSILQSEMHIIASMRVKTEYAMNKGSSTPKKIGMAPIMRDGVEYEFDIVFDLDTDHNATVSKTRCSEIDGQVFSPLTESIGELIGDWASGKDDPTVKKMEDLPEDRVTYLKSLAKQVGEDAEKAVETALNTRRIPGTQDVLTPENLDSNLIDRLEKKVESLKASE